MSTRTRYLRPASGRRTVCVALPASTAEPGDRALRETYVALATHLADVGLRVTLAVAGQREDDAAIRALARAHGIGVAEWTSASRDPVHGPEPITRALEFYHWMRRRTDDLLHVPEAGGLPYYALLARRQGRCLRSTRVCVGVLRPTLWARDATRTLVSSVDDLLADQLERGTVEMADAVWSLTPAMVRWLDARAWSHARAIRVLPRPRAESATPVGPGRDHTRVRHVAFVGQIDEATSRIDLFCDALTALVSAPVRPETALFLGRPGAVGGRPAEESLAERGRSWPWPWRIEAASSTNETVARLAGTETVAVVLPRCEHAPALLDRLASAGIPFLTADDAFVTDAIRRRDRPAVVVPRHAIDLASRIASWLASGATVARPAADLAAARRGWASYTSRLLALPVRGLGRGARAARPPLVSVCVTSHNRPYLLRHALASLERQDYPRVQVVLVDDSTEASAVHAIERLGPRLARRGGILARRPDRFVCAARNHAARLATGRYLLFMDDDNIAKPHAISTLVSALQAARADIVTCFLDVFAGSTGRPSGRDRLGVWPFVGAAIGPALFRNVLGDTNCLMRRTTFWSLGGFDEEERTGFEDWELFGRAVARGLRVEPVPEPLVWSRRSADGMSGRHAGRGEHFRVARSLLSAVDPRLIPVAELAKASWLEGRAADLCATRSADHVRTAAVFGAGELGRQAVALARRCGWRVVHLLDNNPQLRHRTVDGFTVDAPDILRTDGCDLVIIASVAHAREMAAQLEEYGLVAGRDFIHARDAVSVCGIRLQVEG